ncbi:putative gustatory receptor 2a, partial [Pseudolycoriella hygida]
ALSCGHVLDMHNRNSDWARVESFDLWLLHRKIEFNAYNFFKIDLSLLYTIIGALATYTLILIQFKQQEETLVEETSLGKE